MTITERVLNHLKTGKTLTKYQGFSRFNTVHLGDIIYRLKRQGHKIHARMITRNGKTYAIYSMGA